MLKKTVTYTDFNGVEHTEDFYFNLGKAKVIELESEVEGGLHKKLESIVKSKSPKDLIAVYKKLILLSYGQKSDDGKRFIQSKELSNEFSQTPAFDEIFVTIMNNENEAIDFVAGIMPVPASDMANIRNELEATITEGNK